MLAGHRERLAGSDTWIASERRRLDEARAALERAFSELMREGTLHEDTGTASLS